LGIPCLSAFGLDDVLGDPVLTLFDDVKPEMPLRFRDSSSELSVIVESELMALTVFRFIGFAMDVSGFVRLLLGLGLATCNTIEIMQ